MNWFHIIPVWLALIAASAEAVQPEKDAARVQQDVRTLIHALYNADVDTVVRVHASDHHRHAGRRAGHS